MAIVNMSVQLLVGMTSTTAHNHSKMTEKGSLSNIQWTEKFWLMKKEKNWRPNTREKEQVKRVDNDSYLHILYARVCDKIKMHWKKPSKIEGVGKVVNSRFWTSLYSRILKAVLGLFTYGIVGHYICRPMRGRAWCYQRVNSSGDIHLFQNLH